MQKKSCPIGQCNLYFAILHMIGQLKMNESLHEMTPNTMLLYISEEPKDKMGKWIKTHLILIRLIKGKLQRSYI